MKPSVVQWKLRSSKPRVLRLARWLRFDRMMWWPRADHGRKGETGGAEFTLRLDSQRPITEGTTPAEVSSRVLLATSMVNCSPGSSVRPTLPSGCRRPNTEADLPLMSRLRSSTSNVFGAAAVVAARTRRAQAGRMKPKPPTAATARVDVMKRRRRRSIVMIWPNACEGTVRAGPLPGGGARFIRGPKGGR